MSKKWLFAGFIFIIACLLFYACGLIDNGEMFEWIKLPKRVVYYIMFWVFPVVILFYKYFSQSTWVGKIELTTIIVVPNLVAAFSVWSLHDLELGVIVLVIGLFTSIFLAGTLLGTSCYLIIKILNRAC